MTWADPSNPTLINALEYGDRGSSSDLFRDFHALAWLDGDNGGNEFALPVNLYRHSSAPQSPWQHGQFLHRGLYRFAVNEAGLTELSTALLANSSGSRFDDNACIVLSATGEAWFYERDELYYISAGSPSVLQSSQ